MTDNEIIKALECCTTDLERACEKCPLRMDCITDSSTAEKHALDLINRQKAEIERLIFDVTTYRLRWAKATAKLDAAKSEAIKEFAERLCEDRVSNDPVVIAVKTELKFWEKDNG